MWTHLERQEGAIGTRAPARPSWRATGAHPPQDLQAGGGAEGCAPGAGHPAGAAHQERGAGGGHCGYTNAGKSTLLNRLTGAAIPANDRLFDTLDTTTRTLEISDTCTVLISDTVALSQAAHHLVDAFKATLEELEYADLLLHVIDASNRSGGTRRRWWRT